MADYHETADPLTARDGARRHGRNRVRSRALVAIVCSFAMAVVWAPIEAQQPPKVPRIGLLTGATEAGFRIVIEGFRQGMRELGYVEGKMYVLEPRYGEGKSERLEDFARELVGRNVDLIVATTDAPIAAVKRETRTIPIVMTSSTDPVGTGLVASLARPGGNVTGLTTISADLSGKRLSS